MRMIRELIKRTFKGFYKVHAPTMASSIGFFALMTIAPFAVLTLWVGSLLFGRTSTRATIIQFLSQLLGPTLGNEMIRLVGSESQKNLGTISGIIGGLLLLYGAASLFLAVQRALNEVWRVKIAKSTDLGFHVAIRAAVVFATVFLPAALLTMLAVTRGLVGGAAQAAPDKSATAVSMVGGQLLYVLGAWALIAVLFALLPDATIGWRSIALGSGIAAIGWSVGTWVFGIYFSSTVASRYQLAGSFVAALLWVFLMAQIMLAGARLAYEHACLSGRPIEPRPWAELYERVPEDQQPDATGSETVGADTDKG
jgi:membrane protein